MVRLKSAFNSEYELDAVTDDFVIPGVVRCLGTVTLHGLVLVQEVLGAAEECEISSEFVIHVQVESDSCLLVFKTVHRRDFVAPLLTTIIPFRDHVETLPPEVQPP